MQGCVAKLMEKIFDKFQNFVMSGGLNKEGGLFHILILRQGAYWRGELNREGNLTELTRYCS